MIYDSRDDDNKTLDNKSDDRNLDEELDGKKEDENIKKLTEEKEDLEARWKRALADYQNLERRTSEIRREWILESNKDLIAKLLPVLDTLFLASRHLKDEGLRLSIQKFLDTLKDEGVERIETEGKTFDPNLMEATESIEGEKDKVVEEIRPGFILNDKVLRPAQVKVGSAKQNQEK